MLNQYSDVSSDTDASLNKRINVYLH